MVAQGVYQAGHPLGVLIYDLKALWLEDVIAASGHAQAVLHIRRHLFTGQGLQLVKAVQPLAQAQIAGLVQDVLYQGPGRQEDVHHPLAVLVNAAQE